MRGVFHTTEEENAAWLRESVIVAFISLLKLKFLAYLLNVTQRFGYVSWPHSSDLIAPDSFLWGYLKSKVYSNRLTDLHPSKETYRKKSPDLQKIHFKPLCEAS
jgi:hypothetical protein